MNLVLSVCRSKVHNAGIEIYCKGQTHPREKGCNNEGGEGVIICKMFVLA